MTTVVQNTFPILERSTTGRFAFSFNYGPNNPDGTNGSIAIFVGASSTRLYWVVLPYSHYTITRTGDGATPGGIISFVSNESVDIYLRTQLTTNFPSRDWSTATYQYVGIARIFDYDNPVIQSQGYSPNSTAEADNYLSFLAQQLDSRVGILESATKNISVHSNTLTLNFLPKCSEDGTANLEDSRVYDTGTLVTVFAPTTINGALIVNGNTTLNGTFTLSGAANFLSTMTINGLLTAAGGFAMTGNLGVTGAITATGDLNISGNGLISGNLTVIGILTSTGLLNVTGAIKITGDLDVTGNTNLAALTVTSLINNGTSLLKGAVTMQAGLTVTGPTGIVGTVTIQGNTGISGTLSVSGGSTFGGGFTAQAPSTCTDLTVSGLLKTNNLTPNPGPLTIGGNTTITGNLAVQDITCNSLTATTFVTGATLNAALANLTAATIVTLTNSSAVVDGVTLNYNIDVGLITSGAYLGFGASTAPSVYNMQVFQPGAGGGGGGGVTVTPDYVAIGGSLGDTVVASQMFQDTPSLSFRTGYSYATTGGNLLGVGGYTVGTKFTTSPTKLDASPVIRVFDAVWSLDQDMVANQIAPLYMVINPSDNSKSIIAPATGLAAGLTIQPPFLSMGSLYWIGFTGVLANKVMDIDSEIQITGSTLANATFSNTVTIQKAIDALAVVTPTGTVLTLNSVLYNSVVISYNAIITAINVTIPAGENLVMYFFPLVDALAVDFPSNWYWPVGLEPDSLAFTTSVFTVIELRNVGGFLFATVVRQLDAFSHSVLSIYGNKNDNATLFWLGTSGRALSTDTVARISNSTISDMLFSQPVSLQRVLYNTIAPTVNVGTLVISIVTNGPMLFAYTRNATLTDIAFSISSGLTGKAFFFGLLNFPGTSSDLIATLPVGTYTPGGHTFIEFNAGSGSHIFYRDPNGGVFLIPGIQFQTTLPAVFGDLTTTNTVILGAYMAVNNNLAPDTHSDTAFLITDCTPPTSATSQSLVYNTGLDLNNNLVLASSPLITNGTGTVVNTGVNFSSVINNSTILTEVAINVTTATQNLDLSLGNIFALTYASTCAYTFTNIPVGKIVPVMIKWVHDATTTIYTPTFTNWVKEGGQAPVLTQSAGGVDIMVGYVDGTGIFWSSTVINNYLPTTTTNIQSAPQTTVENDKVTLRSYFLARAPDLSYERICLLVDDFFLDPDNYTARCSPYCHDPEHDHARHIHETPDLQALTPNTLCATNTAGEVVATDIVVSGTNFTSEVTLQNVTLKAYNQTLAALTPGATVVIPLSSPNYLTLAVNQNMSITMSALPPAGQVITFTIFCTHDNTANVYNLTFPGAIFNGTPSITNTASAKDILTITVSSAEANVVIRQAYS